MQIVSFRVTGSKDIRLGALTEKGLRDITKLVKPAATVAAIAAMSSADFKALGAKAAKAPLVPAKKAKLVAPIPRPGRNIFCVGKNYREHAKEFADSGFDASAKEIVPEAPVVFTKPPSSVIGPGAKIPAHLDDSNSTDYEGELAVVIGKGGRGIAKAKAMSHVFGYTIVNDVTARELQQKHRQWVLGKGIDGFCPMGPAVVTKDEIKDPKKLQLKTWINGELRQNQSVADLIFDIPTLISWISRYITLEPGDIIATGTPVGVGIGFKPPKFLKKGDKVKIEVAGIGVLENTVA